MKDWFKGIFAYVIYVPVIILLILVPLGFIFGLISTILEVFFQESTSGTILRLSFLGIVSLYFWLLYYVNRIQKKRLVMKLFKVIIPNSKLSLMPQNERTFFILFGAFLNDLNMFQKLMVFSTNNISKNQVVRAAQNMQTLSLAKFMTGILSEGWQLLQKNYFGSQVSKVYEPLLQEKARQSLENLKEYFSTNENWMCSVRNRFCFHYPTTEEIAKLIDDTPASDIFEIFMSEYYGNCLFSMSNTLINFGILKSTGGSDLQSAMDKFLQDGKKVSRWFGDFLGECLLVIANKHLGFKHIEVKIPEPPDVYDVDLPYFIKAE